MAVGIVGKSGTPGTDRARIFLIQERAKLDDVNKDIKFRVYRVFIKTVCNLAPSHVGEFLGAWKIW